MLSVKCMRCSNPFLNSVNMWAADGGCQLGASFQLLPHLAGCRQAHCGHKVVNLVPQRVEGALRNRLQAGRPDQS
jgi:DNA-directed RNA polymerase subunit RPC12/RpoP